MIQRWITMDLSLFYAVLHADLCSPHAGLYLLYTEGELLHAEFNILHADSRSKHTDSYLLHTEGELLNAD